MKNVCFIVDSSSGIKNGDYDNVFVVPLVITVTNKNDSSTKIYHDGIDINEKTFCDFLHDSQFKINTSQASIGEIIEVINNVYDKYDEIYAIPIASHISSSINTWNIIKKDYEKLHVCVNNEVAIGMKWCVEDLLKMWKEGKLNKDSFNDYFNNYVNSNRIGVLSLNNVQRLVDGGRLSNFKSLILKLFKRKIVIFRDEKGIHFYKTSNSFIEGINIALKGIKEKFANFDLSKIKRFGICRAPNNLNNEQFEEAIKYTKSLIKCEYKESSDIIPNIILAHTGDDCFYIVFDFE